MLALDFLRAAFADGVLFGVKMTRVRAPLIGVVVRQTEGIEQRFELEKHLIFPAAKDIRQHLSRLMINGMPEPARVAFAAARNDHISSISASPARSMSTVTSSGFSVFSKCRVDRLQRRFFLLEFTEHGVRTDVQRPCRIPNPAGIEAHIDDELLHLGQAASVAVVEQKTAGGARLILAQVALGAAGGFAAFDNLIAVTVRTSDGDECRHGPLLGDGCCRDLAQCDINFSPSPL